MLMDSSRNHPTRSGSPVTAGYGESPRGYELPYRKRLINRIGKVIFHRPKGSMLCLFGKVSCTAISEILS